MATNLTTFDILEAVFYCTNGPQAGLNVIHYQVSAIIGIPTDQMAADVLSGAASITYPQWLASDSLFYGVKVQIINRTPKPAAVSSVIGQQVGIAGGVTLPGQAAGIITKLTRFAGRSYRGRMYVPFPGETLNTGTPPEVSMAGQGLLLAIANTVLIAQPGGIGGNNCIISPVIADKHGTVRALVNGFTIRSKWATQRRRGDYGRANTPPF